MKYPPKLQHLIERYYTDLEFSLQTSGLNGRDNHWDSAIINQNACKSAGILIVAALRHLKHWDMFLQAIIIGCRRDSLLLDTMEMICTTFEHLREFPPLGIIQYALNPKLLEVYGASLADWLEKYLQITSDSTSLPSHLVLKYYLYKNTEGVTNEILECCGIFADVKEH